MARLVLIEYTERVTSSPRHAGGLNESTIDVGTRRRVDAASAAVLVKRGVAKLVDKAQEP